MQSIGLMKLLDFLKWSFGREIGIDQRAVQQRGLKVSRTGPATAGTGQVHHGIEPYGGYPIPLG